MHTNTISMYTINLITRMSINTSTSIWICVIAFRINTPTTTCCPMTLPLNSTIKKEKKSSAAEIENASHL